jgi:hypothetical protein
MRCYCDKKPFEAARQQQAAVSDDCHSQRAPVGCRHRRMHRRGALLQLLVGHARRVAMGSWWYECIRPPSAIAVFVPVQSGPSTSEAREQAGSTRDCGSQRATVEWRQRRMHRRRTMMRRL